MQNEFRKDYLLERYTITASGRAKRPSEFKPALYSPQTNEEYSKDCPFCQGNELLTPPEIYSAKDESGKWIVRVFENKFPVLQKEAKFSKPKAGFFQSFPAYGFHEVIVESPKHNILLQNLPENNFLVLLNTVSKRCRELLKKKNISHCLVFKNFGFECGASIEHSHIQLIALPKVPDLIEEEISASKKFYSKKKKCVYCAILREEKKERIVFENKQFIALTPFASVWPYEIWILGKKHKSSLQEFGEEEMLALADALKHCLKAFGKLFGTIQYNFVFHESSKHLKQYHFHIEIYPNIGKRYGGIEKGDLLVVNEVPSEIAAGQLRGEIV